MLEEVRFDMEVSRLVEKESRYSELTLFPECHELIPSEVYVFRWRETSGVIDGE